MEHPKAVGDRCTLAVMLALQSAGFVVLMPFGENTRYDLVIDDGKRLARVQCKSGRFRGGAVRFNTASTYDHHGSHREARRPYLNQIDYFGVHCPATGAVYLVPIDDVPTTAQAALRVEPARNGQRRGVRLAGDYKVAVLSVQPHTRLF